MIIIFVVILFIMIGLFCILINASDIDDIYNEAQIEKELKELKMLKSMHSGDYYE